jgi:hypothetical protein
MYGSESCSLNEDEILNSREAFLDLSLDLCVQNTTVRSALHLYALE